MLELFIGLFLGALLMYGMYSLFNRKRRKDLTSYQSTVLLEKVRAL